MEPAFTLGILYGCGRGFRTAQYFEQLAAYYLKSMSRVRVLIALTSKAERSVASCLLEQRAKHSGLEVAVVLTARQWREYQQNISHGKAAECNPIIDAADRREVMKRCAERFSPPELFRLFIERCDLLVFQEHHAGAQMVGLLRELLTDMAVRCPCNTNCSIPAMRACIIRPTGSSTEYTEALITIPIRRFGRASPTCGATIS